MKKDLKSMSDEELQFQLKKGNNLAFDVIFDRYWKRLYTYAYNIFKEEEVCEDIVQEIFISFWKNIETATILHLESYLFRAVKYKIANHIRDLKFTQEHLDVLEFTGTSANTINDIEYKDFEKEIMMRVNELSPKCREVFLMSRFEEYSNQEIASKLNLSIHTVEKHISNALKVLRSTISSHLHQMFP
ncbi:DNA-directed RNA polymerase sigma-70 factor [Flavobacterium flevense]|uniref:DNA-directed RNA polymerase sigma-70 factor n=2 Tax=Flavobacterium flevense TaxID=983 RepID=A0A4Y4AVJ5_9FLAO|nr:RNA polymerase sigma-70 factor [Flavobacterium flevense]GEC71369.1 DNA-directed RNA polymerase sigma-70 factor [Flavobacterium flevense]